MGRKCTIHKYLGEQIGGVIIQRKLDEYTADGRRQVECLCMPCGKLFVATFHNVYRGNYKSCGCLQHALARNSPRWRGHGEISQSFYNSIRQGALKRNMEFSLPIDTLWALFLKQNRKCALSGVQLTFPSRAHSSDQEASLDRIDSSIGYVENNIQWVHKDVNFMKQDFTTTEFLKWIETIYKYNLK